MNDDMNNIKCRQEALVIADALELLDTGMCSPRDGAAELRRQHAEIERLTVERDALRADVERITEAGMAHIRRASQIEAERDVLRVTLEARQAQVPAAWAHPDGRVVPAATMFAAVRDGGAMRSSLAGYTIPLYTAPQPPREVERLTDEQIREVLLSASRDAAVKLGVPADELGEPDEDSLHSATMVARWVEPAMAAAWGMKLED